MASATRQPQPSTGAACSEAQCRSSWLPRPALYRWCGQWSPVVLIEIRGPDATIVDSDGDLIIVELGRIRVDVAAVRDEVAA